MQLTQVGPLLTPAKLDAFEAESGARLPGEYRDFLLTTNGGLLEPEHAFHWRGKWHQVIVFGTLLKSPDSGLRRALWELRELRCDGYLPFAMTLNQEDICLSFSNDFGSVWFADYSLDRCAVQMRPLESSFTAFLGKLVPVPSLFCPVSELGGKGTPEDLTDFLAEGNSVDALSKNGHSILCEAIKYGNLPVIQACIDLGASLSKSICLAAFNRRPELIELLANAGADVNEPTEGGHRPLSFVGGTKLPGKDGALNRRVREILIKLGAVE